VDAGQHVGGVFGVIAVSVLVGVATFAEATQHAGAIGVDAVACCHVLGRNLHQLQAAWAVG